MRKIVSTIFAVATLSLAPLGGASAQTLEDAEARGRAIFNVCPTDDLVEPLQQPLREDSECCVIEDLEPAILDPLREPLREVSYCCAVEYLEPALQDYSAYVAELVAAGVITEEEALLLFQRLRDVAREADCDEAIDALFEDLFPDTAFTGGGESGAVTPGTPGDGDGDGAGGVIGPDVSPSQPAL